MSATPNQIKFIDSLIAAIRAGTTEESAPTVQAALAPISAVLARHFAGQTIEKSEAATVISRLIDVRDNVLPKPPLGADLLALAEQARSLGVFFASKMVDIIDAGKALTPNQEAALRRVVESSTAAADRPDDGYVPAEADLHLVDGEIVYLKRAKAGHLYGLLGPDRRFDHGLLAQCSAATLVTAEIAAQYGVDHGWCVCCGRTLTDPESIARGIGPVCAEGRGW